MVMYFQRAVDEKSRHTNRAKYLAQQGGLPAELEYLDSPEGRELIAKENLQLGRLIAELGVNDILFSSTTPDFVKINFGGADSLVDNYDGRHFSVDFPPGRLAALTAMLPEPTYHVSHERRAFLDADAPEIEGVSQRIYEPTSPWRTEFRYITIEVLTGDVARRISGEDVYHKIPTKTYSKREIKDMRHGPTVILETKRVSGLPFGIHARYEVTIVEPVKARICVNSSVDGSWVEVREDYISNPNVAKALDAVVQYLLNKSISPPTPMIGK